MTAIVLAYAIFVAGAAWGCTSPDSRLKPDSTPSVAPSPAEQADEQSRFLDTFIGWAAAYGVEKLEYELKSVSLGVRPMLRETYSREHFKNFQLVPRKICPRIEGRCLRYEDGFELQFDVEVSGVNLPGGVVEFNHAGQIVGYEKGPLSEITRVLSATEARARASVGCKGQGLTVDPKAEPHFTSYRKGGLQLRNGHAAVSPEPPDAPGTLSWLFPLRGKVPKHCFYVQCAVDAITGATDVAWRCGGALLRPRYQLHLTPMN